MSEIRYAPVPQGRYVPATRTERIVFSAGMTARKNGIPIMSGCVRTAEPLETYREAVRLAAQNALTAVENVLRPQECIAQILTMTVYINAEKDFTAHSKLADFASEYLCEVLGECGIAARTAVGVESLPANAPVEISLVCGVG